MELPLIVATRPHDVISVNERHFLKRMSCRVHVSLEVFEQNKFRLMQLQQDFLNLLLLANTQFDLPSDIVVLKVLVLVQPELGSHFEVTSFVRIIYVRKESHFSAIYRVVEPDLHVVRPERLPERVVVYLQIHYLHLLYYPELVQVAV